RNAAQQTVRRCFDRGVCSLRASPVIQSALSYRIEVGILTCETGEIEPIAKFAAKDRAIERIIIVDHRMNDRNLTLRVRLREAEVINGSRFKIAAITLAGKECLRDRLAIRILERVSCPVP